MITGNAVWPLGNCKRRFDEKLICLALGVMFLAVSFISTFLLAFAIPANAQERPRTARIGILRVDARKSPAAVEAIQHLKQGLSNLGYVEGQNVNFEIRWADNKLDHLPGLAAELVRLKSDVVVTGGPQAVRALREATGTIPVVMGRMDDVVEHGLVTSLARPGGNITGLSFQTGELSGKWLDLLREVLPKLSRAAVLWDTSGTSGQLRTAEQAARSMGLQLQVSKVLGLNEHDHAFEGIRKQHAEALVILASPIFTAQRARLADLTVKHRLPAIYYHEGFTEAGGLLAYGPKLSEFSWHRAAIFVDKILKGARPADLPVEQPTNFDLVINMKAAKQIGMTIPPNVLARADRVIK